MKEYRYRLGYALTDIKTGDVVEYDPLTGKLRPAVLHALDLRWGVAVEDIAAGDAVGWIKPGYIGKITE